MKKHSQLLICISIMLFLAICALILDNHIEAKATEISFAVCDWTPRSGGPDLGGNSLVSEILRYFVLLFTISPLWIAFLIELREKPIERIELNLNKL